MQTKNPVTRAALAPQELARRWNVHVNTIYNMLNSGQLQGFRARNTRRITMEEIEQVEQFGTRPSDQEVSNG